MYLILNIELLPSRFIHFKP